MSVTDPSEVTFSVDLDGTAWAVRPLRGRLYFAAREAAAIVDTRRREVTIPSGDDLSVMLTHAMRVGFLIGTRKDGAA